VDDGMESVLKLSAEVQVSWSAAAACTPWHGRDGCSGRTQGIVSSRNRADVGSEGGAENEADGRDADYSGWAMSNIHADLIEGENNEYYLFEVNSSQLMESLLSLAGGAERIKIKSMYGDEAAAAVLPSPWFSHSKTILGRVTVATEH
jgi:hypothetical protein